ncbi:bifunctional hydroxymethylpyrimidine kinase/phosphomethylpyrimidine kinase [Collinsella bouchesdurhonensis]|uniref:bifunctional hydroxymethylpyrimidine kinase/phosphomethylpyrimidine kinase n=1 Tax=Collinsella bouchesdurhonensis TaxID=1907654 RepID=UPI003563AE1A
MGISTLPAVLTIAGSDSSGGAGVQADVKTIAAHGLFSECAITAITAQNTCGVRSIQNIDPAVVADQIDMVFEDIRPAAVKIGMVSSSAIIEKIAERLKRWEAQNIVVDPVMVATSGARLIDAGAQEALTLQLFPLATLITPNIPEAELLAGAPIKDEKSQEQAARLLVQRYGCATLVKGGHRVNEASDVLACETNDGLQTTWFTHPRVDNPNTHGTGCTLSSAIACGLAQNLSLVDAVEAAKRYLTGALEAQLDLGQGSGPLDHMWRYRQGYC